MLYRGRYRGVQGFSPPPPPFTENYPWILQPRGPDPPPLILGLEHIPLPPTLLEIQTFSLGYIYLIHMKPPLKK